MSTTALLTDRYELTMLDASLRDGTADRPSVFEVFTRDLPDGRRYGVLAGVGRLVEALGSFRFDEGTVAHLDDAGVVSPATLAQLADWRFTGDVDTYREGEVHFPDSPVLSVHAPFGQAVVLETLVLSILNHDSAVAAAAARMVGAAGSRPLLEFGSRRTHEQAAVAAARAAYVAGFAGTSNLEAGRRYGIPTLGTSAHAYTLVHDREIDAFRAQVEALGVDTTLLIDTYEVAGGLDGALDAAGPQLGGVRIDSGDLAEHARATRRRLDDAGATDTRIVLSGDLDEHRIAALGDVPADAYGVGTSLVTGSGAPTAGLVYKLVARARSPQGPLEPVAKGGGAKATTGGRKAAFRRLEDGVATAEVLRPWDGTPPADARALQVPLIRDGEVVHDPSLDEIRAHHASAMAELPADARQLDPGGPAVPTLAELDTTSHHGAHRVDEEVVP